MRSVNTNVVQYLAGLLINEESDLEMVARSVCTNVNVVQYLANVFAKFLKVSSFRKRGNCRSKMYHTAPSHTP